MRALSILFLSIAVLGLAVAVTTLFLYRDPASACTASAFLDYPFPANVTGTAGHLTAWPALDLQCVYAMDDGRSITLTQWAPAGVSTIVAPVSFALALLFGAAANRAARRRRLRGQATARSLGAQPGNGTMKDITGPSSPDIRIDSPLIATTYAPMASHIGA